MQQQGSFITFRTHQIMRQYERIAIQIDGKQVGELGNNEEIQIPVSKGTRIITSKDLWGIKAYPLHLTLGDTEEIEIQIEQVAGTSKFQFVVETDIPQAHQMNEYHLVSRKLAWDLDCEIAISKIDNSILYFDLKNYAFPRPSRFEINLQNQKLKVFACKKRSLLLYESDVNIIESLSYPFVMLENIIEHTFYRADGTLLGYLSLESDQWIISSKRQQKIAEIGLLDMNKDRLQPNHYLQSLEYENSMLAIKKWDHPNILQFQNINIPDREYNEILMLAFITFSALAWGKVVDYATDKALVRL
jgi:hypothetical protein